LKKILFVPDTHRPYHDKRKWELMLRAGKHFKPDVIVTLGDFADFYAVSAHDKNPNRISNLEWEVEDVKVGLNQLQSLGAGRHIYVSGNHEDRLERYLMRRGPELFSLVRIPELLKLRENHWQYIPYKQHVKIGKLHITHDTGKAGAYAHYQAQAAFQGNVIIGHTHRIGYAVVGNVAGKPHVGAQLGWLGDLAQVDYMHKINALRDWAHGFGVGYMEASGNVHVVPVPIVGGACLIEGQLIR
jgi:predicted phosphodiesterase